MRSISRTIIACCSLLLLIGCHKEQSGIAFGVYKLPWEGDYIITPIWGGELHFGIVIDSADRHELFCTGAYYPYGLEVYDWRLEIPETVIANVRDLNNGYRTVSYTVTGISNYAFDGSDLTSVTLPNSIREIGDNAFEKCTSLTNIALPEGLQSIGYQAFSGCTSLTNIALPESLQSIGYHAFGGCTSLINIALPEGLQSIGYQAFSGCTSLTNIALPEGLQSIEYHAFGGCSSLTTCTCYALDPPEVYWDSFEGCPLQAIYVPRESVETYKTADGWEHYADIIYPIE